MRFIYIILGAFAGFFGIAIGIFIHLCLMTSTASFGVPYLTPFSPTRTDIFKDDLLITPLWKQEHRPTFLRTKKPIREPHISRKWAKSKKELNK